MKEYIKIISVLAAITTPLVGASNEELIINGSFETGTPPRKGSYKLVSGSNVTGWTTTPSNWYMQSSFWGSGGPAGGGKMLVNLNGTAPLSQSFSVNAGTEYTVSYFELRRGYGGRMDATLDLAGGTFTVFSRGKPVAVTASSATRIVQTTAINNAWKLHSFKFIPNTTTTATLTFRNHFKAGVLGDNDGVFVDLVRIVPHKP
ncbi:MAG: DUF642 domain-containing protein [Akkermansiaceae bacterium]|nr:DUF642 domain-containing protein [Akkermansiaceae bacterium]